MTVWREVQETLYQRWAAYWAARTPYALENETFDPPDAPWARVSVKGRPSGPGTIGRPGNRRMDRAGVVFVQLFEPPGDGVGGLSDLAEQARDAFENCRFGPHDIRFAEADIGQEAEIEGGRWWGVTVEARFDYEDLK